MVSGRLYYFLFFFDACIDFSPARYLISPLTGEKIPVDSMESHMKIALLDPRWKEQKEKAIEEKRQQEQVFAEGIMVYSGPSNL